MKINNHTIICATKDNDLEMGKFYTEMLGFEKNENGGYSNGSVEIYFDRHSQAAVKALEPFRMMLTLNIDDVVATYEELKSKGVQFVREPSKEEWGGMFATLVDPDGNYVQIFQM